MPVHDIGDSTPLTTGKCQGICKNKAPCRFKGCETHDDSVYCKVHGRIRKKMDGIPTCSICLENVKKNTKKLPCDHVFCTKCIGQWTKLGNNTCPMCRHDIVPVVEQSIEEKVREYFANLFQNIMYDVHLQAIFPLLINEDMRARFPDYSDGETLIDAAYQTTNVSDFIAFMNDLVGERAN